MRIVYFLVEIGYHGFAGKKLKGQRSTIQETDFAGQDRAPENLSPFLLAKNGEMMQHGPPPENESTLRSMEAARRVGVYTKQLVDWVREGLVRGGCYYRHEGKTYLTWWVSEDDIASLIEEGGRGEGIKKRRRQHVMEAMENAE